MKKLLWILFFVTALFGAEADVKPFVYDGVSDQQAQYEYMLKYKLYGYEYLKIGQNDTIPDKSGWNGSAIKVEMKHAVVLGGPILTAGPVDVGNGDQFTGPVRGTTFSMGNDNNSTFAGKWCFETALSTDVQNIIKRSEGTVSCDSVPVAPAGLKIPTIEFPDTTKINITVGDRGKEYVEIPDVPTYDLYVNSIKTGTEDTLYFRMKNKGTLTRVFVKEDISFGNHTVVQVVYASPAGDSVITQDKFRGNLLFYTQEDFNIRNTDYSFLQGTYISKKKINLISNINFAGQLLANELEIGDNFSGKNFRFVKFNPDTINVNLEQYGGLMENDSTVILPIELSDTTDIDVYFAYCFNLKDGVDTSDFNIPPAFPICGFDTVSAVIPVGNKTPSIPIQINVRKDTLIENEYLIMHIDSISGAILPDGETQGDLKIKIIDYDYKKYFGFDTNQVFVTYENYTGFVDTIKVLNASSNLRYTLDSSAAGRYELDSITGVLTLKEELDFETIQKDYIKVTVTDTANKKKTDILAINILDVNEKPELDDVTFYLPENVPIPSIVGTLKATDPDQNSSFTQNEYELLTPSQTFQIDPKSGRITATKLFNYEKDDSVYVLTVRVYDKTDVKLADTAKVTIKISNVNESPSFGKDDTTFVIKENTPAGFIGNVTATDEDGDSLTYKIIGTVPFKIDTATGDISSTRPFDYEKEKNFTFKVEVTDVKGNTDTITVKVIIDNVNEPVDVKDTTFSIDEGKVGELGKVTGVDEDGDSIKYSISNTDDYSISSTGTITLVNPFDYEQKKYDTLTVYVTDGEFTDSAKVVVKINNVNENPVLQPNDSLKVPENCKNCIVGIITATDPDGDTITYTVKEPGFTIDSAGVLKLTDPLDYETTKEVPITIIAKDPNGGSDTLTYVVKVTDINEPVHTKDTTCTVKENYTGNVCKITGTDEDKTPVKYIVTDTTNYSIDSTGQLYIKNPIDYEKKTKDTVKVIVTDGEYSDTATVIIRVLDEDEIPKIKTWDDEQPKDTVKTNDPDHKFEWELCEGAKCTTGEEFPHIRKDTTIKVCNAKKTKCDSIVVLFNDKPPVVILTNTKSTDALIDYITIEEQADDKIYVNKKDNELTVTVRDTVKKTEKRFNIEVKLDTLPTKDIKIKEYNYLIDESLAQSTLIGKNLVELKETINDNGTVITLTKIVDKNGNPVDTIQTVSYTKKVNGKDVVVSYKTDNLTGQKIGDYEVSYMIDSCTKVTYTVDDKKKIVKNKEGNIAYTITYEYTDDFGNKASSKVEIVFDDIPPKVEILNPDVNQTFHTNAIPVKWTVNGEVQDTLTLQRLEQGVNWVIRRYVDKAGNVSADTVMVLMKEAKAIVIELVNPVTKVNQDKVDSFYSENKKFDKQYTVSILKGDEKPDPVGVGLKVDIALPSVSPTGGLATLDDIVKNGMIPVDDKGNIVGASTKGIPVDEYVEQHCTEDFRREYKKNGLKLPLYDVTYNLHLWVYTTQANYVNDFNIEYKLNDEDEVSSAGTVTMVIDYIADRDGNVNAKNGHALGTGAYITKLFSKSVAKHRCDYKNQVKGDRTVKKDEDMTTFGYKRPIK